MSEKQVIISIGREFGSGGHEIAVKLSERLNLPLYDYNILHEISVEKNVNQKNLEQYDEIPKSTIFSRRVRGYSNSPEENIAKMQFDYLRKKATEGKSYIVVGRCSETILKGHEGLITVFILGDMEVKIERISKIHNISKVEAENMIYHQDKKRKNYHNYYCQGKWGDSRNYDFSINSSKLGIDITVDVLEDYIKRRIEKM